MACQWESRFSEKEKASNAVSSLNNGSLCVYKEVFIPTLNVSSTVFTPTVFILVYWNNEKEIFKHNNLK